MVNSIQEFPGQNSLPEKIENDFKMSERDVKEYSSKVERSTDIGNEGIVTGSVEF